MLATSMIGQLSFLDHRIEQSDAIIEARIVKSESFMDDDEFIQTKHHLDVYKVFKGNRIDQLALLTAGGELENEGLMVFPSWNLIPDQIGVFFLRQIEHSRDKENAVYVGVAHRHSILMYDELTAEISDFTRQTYDVSSLHTYLERKCERPINIVEPYQLRPSTQSRNAGISSISPQELTAGNGSVLTISGNGFLNGRGHLGSVFFRNIDLSPEFINLPGINYSSWTDSEIKVEVPMNAGPGPVVVRDSNGNYTPISSDEITVRYNIINVASTGEEVRLIDDSPDNNGYTLKNERQYIS